MTKRRVPAVRLEPNHCLVCDEPFNALEVTSGAPRKVDDRYLNVTICDCCGHLMKVNSNFDITELDEAERAEVEQHPAIVEHQRAVGAKKH